jgi:hypothetical protein
MEEIKARQKVIGFLMSPQTVLPTMAVYEFSYFQLRMICELIALSCLAAHGDIPDTHSARMRETYAADAIIKKLETLHPEFYPTAGTQILDDAGRPIRVDRLQDGYLTKPDCLRLYHKCGEILHRGNLKDILSSGPPKVDLTTIREWGEKIVKLLGHHQIQLIDPKFMLWVLMNEKTTGRVHATIMVAQLP